MDHNVKNDVAFGADVVASRAVKMKTTFTNKYLVECYDRSGKLKWVENVFNLVTSEGLDDLLDKYFKGSTYTAGFFVGLVDNENFNQLAATDDAAGITTGVPSSATNLWKEHTAYTEGTREALTLGSVSGASVDNSASKASFSINATDTLYGAFVITNSTKGGTTGVLYGVAAFSSTRNVESGDTVNVTVTLTAATA